jgi:arsenate reductase (thioredoxin)
MNPASPPRAADSLIVMKRKVLFVCIHNSARSQMAEAWLRAFGGDFFEVESAGLEPGKLNPLAVEAMQEVGIDISSKRTQSTRDVLEAGKIFTDVITVCDETNAARCPVFPGDGNRLQWSFRDPSTLTGSHLQKLDGVRQIRDEIRRKVHAWSVDVCPEAFGISEDDD